MTVRPGILLFSVLCLLILLAACPSGVVIEEARSFDDDREVFVINNLAQTLSVINADTLEIQNDIQLTGGSSPYSLFERDGKLYVVNSLSNTIVRFDESTLD